MYKTILVSSDIEDGKRILDCLERSGWKITAAFWFHFEDEDRWKLIVVSPDVSDKGPKSLYTQLSMLLYDLANDPFKPLQFPLERIMLVTPSSLVYKNVKQGTGFSTTTGPIRQALAEDAYIYRMS